MLGIYFKYEFREILSGAHLCETFSGNDGLSVEAMATKACQA